MNTMLSVPRCRICACEEDSNNFSDIFDDSWELEMKITKLLPIMVMSWDPMPHKVCPACIHKLNLFDEFYENSLRAEKLLRTLHQCMTQDRDANPSYDASATKTPEKSAESVVPTINDVRSLGSNRYSKRTSNRFSTTELSEEDSVVTFRACLKTFRNRTASLTQSCVDYNETEEDVEEERRCLQPLKIRLFSIRSGLYVCDLCQGFFEKKPALVAHLKTHFVEGSYEMKETSKKTRGRKRRKQEEDEDWLKTFKRKSTKKRSSGRPKKKTAKGADSSKGKETNADCVHPSDSSLAKETVERAIQCSQIGDDLDGRETEIDYEKIRQIPTSFISNEEDLPNTNELEVPLKKNENPEGDILVLELEDEFIETPKVEEEEEEVTVVEVVNKQSPNVFSSCVFCDKIFATKDALISHQNGHLQGWLRVGYRKVDSGPDPRPDPTADRATFSCSVCAMPFTNKKTLLEHEQYHLVVRGQGRPIWEQQMTGPEAALPTIMTTFPK